MTNENKKSWQELLITAVNTPGTFNEAYNAFHNYSIGNQILALIQCHLRGITPGPIATFPGWKEKGRFVRKGEKALMLCMPIIGTKKAKAGDEDQEGESYKFFVCRNNWFVLSQTDGEPYSGEAAPEWNKEAALKALEVAEVPFEILNGNAQGYSRRREFAINPLDQAAHSTTFHELAHIVLGHTTGEPIFDSVEQARSLREVEAESVALICCEALNLSGADHSRDYIQHWMRKEGADAIPERNAQRIFAAADRILKAGAVNQEERA